MPAAAHEVPLQLLHERPELLAALLEKIGGAAPIGPLVPVDTNLRFTDPAEVRPDLVFRAERPRWLMLELQNRVDPDKARRWMLAAAALLNETSAMGEIIVLTSSRRVARWAKKVAHVRGDLLGSSLRLSPIVLPIVGKTIDALLDEAHPELAFFAAWAVRNQRGPRARAVVTRAAELNALLPEGLQEAQIRAILNVLGDPLLHYLRDLAMNLNKLPERPAVRQFRLFFEERGKAEGLIEGKREVLLKLLAARGLAVKEKELAIINACVDGAELDQWVLRAASAKTVGEVLGTARRGTLHVQERAPRAGARSTRKRG